MLNNIQKLISLKRPTYKSYYISKYSLLDPYSNHCKIQLRDNTDKYSVTDLEVLVVLVTRLLRQGLDRLVNRMEPVEP
jgi:hypothetical protein